MRKPIRIGTGGWVYEPWRGTFYPPGLPKEQELAYASARLTSLEINSTYYGLKKPADFARWREAAPPGFVFSLKAPRAVTNRPVLAQAGETVARFLSSGILELGEKLGPINWQFPPFKRFDPRDFGQFLALLPASLEGRPLRHAVEVRHVSFQDEAFLSLAERHGVAVVLAADSKYPLISDCTAGFVYARIMGTTDNWPLGYPDEALNLWAKRMTAWAAGEAADLPTLRPDRPEPGGREVFLYVISGFKERNPAACLELIRRVESLEGHHAP